MSAADGPGRGEKAVRRLLAGLAAVSLAAACSVYKFKDMDGRALAAKGRRGRIVSVQTADESIAFPAGDPPAVRDGAVVGRLRMTYTLDPSDISDISPGASGLSVVLKDGSRFRSSSSWDEGDKIRCEAIKTRCIPLDEVLRARVRTVKTAGSILSTIGGAILLAGVVALDVVTADDDGTVAADFVSGLIESGGETGHRRGRHANDALLALDQPHDPAGETDFWAREWMPVDAAPDADGKLRFRLGNASGVTRGVDEAKLVVVDHPPGLSVGPDVRGFLRGSSGLVAPETAVAKDGRDIKGLIAARDGVFWRTAGVDAAGTTAAARDEIVVSFPKPKGARKAKLIVNAANSCWPAEFAREVQARLTAATAARPVQAENKKEKKSGKSKGPATRPGYEDWEYDRLRVQIRTAAGWETGQALFAAGPLPAGDIIYDLDLGDVGSDMIQLKLAPPAGYWLIDRLALDFGGDAPVEAADIPAEDVDGPDAAEVLKALAAEDGTTFLLGPEDPPALLTFTPPPPKEGLERTLFIRTVSRYRMPWLI